ncbi:MAG: BLUF domain-containing protein [Gammaproteobacteria bacterium]|jgi:hypothetical protein|nr:BLUF domain-containing protein [Gammaproteobacteria bacterium]
MSLWAYCYISEARSPVNQMDLRAILETAQAFNRSRDITGCLIYEQGHFAQVLEGGAKELEALMQRIVQDPRHRQVRIVWSGPVERRMFEQWSMAAFNLDRPDPTDSVSIRELRQELAEFIAVSEKNLASFPAFFRFCLACQRAGSEAEEITLETPRFMAG